MDNEVPEVAVSAVSEPVRLLDVREPIEWQCGHIAGAQHIPMQEVPAHLAELAAQGPLVVVCKVGGRSAAITKFLRDNGLDAVNLAGGMVAWAAAGRPMVAETGGEPFVR
jgi:rhodanese-related sulfurtransferase